MVSMDFQRALNNVEGDTWLAELERASLRAAEEKFGDPSDESQLQVRVIGSKDLTAHVGAVVADGIQTATARLAKNLRAHDSAATRLSNEDRDSARLIQRAQIGNLLVFGFPQTLAIADGLPLTPRTPTLAELAARELCEVLPESADDDDALDAAVGSRLALRNALSDIVKAAVTAKGIGLEFDGPEHLVVNSVLTADQAAVLKDSFAVTSELKSTETVSGRLDGIRTRRRIFFLELPDGREISGAIEDDQLVAVTENLNRMVAATLRVTQTVSKGGRAGKRHYRLVQLATQGEIV